MKTIKDYEKEFYELCDKLDYPQAREIKNYIFQELLPQVLNSLKPEIYSIDDGFDSALIDFNRRAKEMGINLPE